ncbi:MAG: DUF2256 domain-containing protein [Burkholderiales bacterium]|nr:DUF2256 domain-containing protein [Burkholderiales bacterium]
MGAKKQGFAGNKSFLPTKTCVACQKPMTWRKSWEKNWEQIKFCSDRCRKQGDTTSKSASR